MRPGDGCVLAEIPSVIGCTTQGRDRESAFTAAREAYEASTGRPLRRFETKVLAQDEVAIDAIGGRSRLADADLEATVLIDAMTRAAAPLVLGDADHFASMRREIVEYLVPFDRRRADSGELVLSVGQARVGSLKLDSGRFGGNHTWTALGRDGTREAWSVGIVRAVAALAATPQFARAVRDRLAQNAAAKPTAQTPPDAAPVSFTTRYEFVFWTAWGFLCGLIVGASAMAS